MTITEALEHVAAKLDAHAVTLIDSSALKMVECGCEPEEVEAAIAASRRQYAEWRPFALTTLRAQMVEALAEWSRE